MPQEFVMLSAVFVAVALGAGTLTSAALQRYAVDRKRLREVTRPQASSTPRVRFGLMEEPNRFAERICRMMPRSERRMSEMRQRLVTAGYRSQTAPVVFAASQIVSALAVGVLVLGVSGEVAIASLSMITGFAIPGTWLSKQIRNRQRVIANGLPDVIDLLIVCLESGSSLDQSILRTAEELGIAYRPLADELTLVASEIRAGTPRAAAFTHFADRTRSDDVRSFVTMLIQTDRYGTSVAQALRVHADLLRTRRRQYAEERAAKANVKLVIPLVLCLFPAFYILTLGPAILQFVRVFLDAVSGTN